MSTAATDTRDPLDPADWTIDVGGESFPFVEDENGNITGLGHADPAAFAAAVNHFDDVCGVDLTDDDRWDDTHIVQAWVSLDGDGETLHLVDEGTPGSFAVTGLWGQR